MKKKEEAKKNNYTLKEGVNVIFRGDLINAVTITDAKAANWIARGFPTIFFSQYPKDEPKEKEVDNNVED